MTAKQTPPKPRSHAEIMASVLGEDWGSSRGIIFRKNPKDYATDMVRFGAGPDGAARATLAAIAPALVRACRSSKEPAIAELLSKLDAELEAVK